MDLLQGLFLVGHVAQAEGQRHAIEALVGERQFLGVALHGGDGQAVIQRPVTPHGQHGGVDVGHPDLDAGLFGHGTGQVSTAGGQIQHLHARAQGRLTHGEVLPEPVQTARHQVIHQVIAAGHRIEHATHPASLLGGIDLLVAKMGFLVGVGHESLREWCFCLRARRLPSPGSGTPGGWDCPGSGHNANGPWPDQPPQPPLPQPPPPPQPPWCLGGGGSALPTRLSPRASSCAR